MDTVTVYRVFQFAMPIGSGASYAVPYTVKYDLKSLVVGNYQLVKITDRSGTYAKARTVPDIVVHICEFDRESFRSPNRLERAQVSVKRSMPGAPLARFTLESDGMLVVEEKPIVLPSYVVASSVEEPLSLGDIPPYECRQYKIFDCSQTVSSNSELFLPLNLTERLRVNQLVADKTGDFHSYCIIECSELSTDARVMIRVHSSWVDRDSFRKRGWCNFEWARGLVAYFSSCRRVTL